MLAQCLSEKLTDRQHYDVRVASLHLKEPELTWSQVEVPCDEMDLESLLTQRTVAGAWLLVAFQEKCTFPNEHDRGAPTPKAT
jgi:hypothetical protein